MHGVPYFVLVMVGVRDVLCLDAPEVQEVVHNSAFIMVVVRGVSSQSQRVHKEAPIFARHMVEEGGALGDSWD